MTTPEPSITEQLRLEKERADEYQKIAEEFRMELDRIKSILAEPTESEPCTPCANWYQAGDTLRIQSVEWGHVFVYWEGPKAPNMQYPICIGCGQPYHVVRDERKEKTNS